MMTWRDLKVNQHLTGLTPLDMLRLVSLQTVSCVNGASDIVSRLTLACHVPQSQLNQRCSPAAHSFDTRSYHLLQDGQTRTDRKHLARLRGCSHHGQGESLPG